MTDPQKDVPKMILRSGLIAAAITGSMILGVLLVLNGDALSSVAGFPDAYNSVASVLGGAQTAFNWFICALIILTIISAGGVWQQGGVRIQAMAGLDGAAPLWFGKFSKQGTPLTMNILSAIIGSIFVVLVFLIAEGSLATFFGIMVSVIISLTAMMYIFQIPAVIMLRKKYPDHPRPFRVPGGRVFLWLCVIGAETIVDHHDHHAAVARPARQRPGPALRHRLLVGRVPGLLRDRDARHRRVLPAHGGRVLGHRQAQHQEGPRRRERPAGDRPCDR